MVDQLYGKYSKKEYNRHLLDSERTSKKIVWSEETKMISLHWGKTKYYSSTNNVVYQQVLVALYNGGTSQWQEWEDWSE